MKGVIETLKFTDSNGEKYNLYPRTLIECISNQNGDSLEDTLQQYVDTQFSDTYADKTYVAEQIAASNHLIREIVTEIPTAETAKDNVIYMYKVDSASGNDVYQEYQLIGGEVVLVGDTSVDLSNYVQSEELDGYLKTTGGKTTGSLYVRDNATTQFVVEHTNGNTPQIAFNGTDGRLGSVLYDAKNGSLKRINGDMNASYTVLDTGNVGEYALPLTGGTLTGNETIANTYPRYWLKNTIAERGVLPDANRKSAIYFKDKNDLLMTVIEQLLETNGDTSLNLGVYSSNPDSKICNSLALKTLQDGTGKIYWAGKEIHHTGNKPNGTYVGNGSTTSNPISAGGIGYCVFVSGNGYGAIVTTRGAVVFSESGTSVEHVPVAQAKYYNGTLTLATTHAALNASGATYTYQVL